MRKNAPRKASVDPSLKPELPKKSKPKSQIEQEKQVRLANAIETSKKFDELTKSLNAKLEYTIELTNPTPSNNIIKNMHFFAYKKLRNEIHAEIIEQVPENIRKLALEQSLITVERHSISQLDWDNCYGGLKPAMDCIVNKTTRNPDGIGLVADDNPTNMPYPPLIVQYPAASRSEQKTILRIFSLK